jgi:NAD(P)-dependent dehydrogenase (short-subunit alcohol dehydrogenase family)
MRTVIISGASSGIGWATAQRFGRAGDYVVNLDIRAPELEPAGQVRWVQVDVAEWSTVEQVVDRVRQERGSLDVVIANAGISIRHRVLEITQAQARRICEVNLLGVLGLWRAATRHMLPARQGVLLATASVNGHRGYPCYADYNATKAGVSALCRTFALELSPHVRVACVTPGAVLTPMQLAEYTEEMLAAVNERIPAGRHAMPEEIADAFFYLASAEARFITGQEIVVDGGEIAGATTTEFGQPTVAPAAPS